ncbi:unnamed protein product [Polarella glacialis]|uniref:Uncharacterized protein n=1 Tax=Polarella glacialis TaxID=89957 RepID=A0A813LET1_POLGL|nr:unnamed protein product [Polarella glacialis]
MNLPKIDFGRSSGDAARVRLKNGPSANADSEGLFNWTRTSANDSFIHMAELQFKACLRCPVPRQLSDRDRQMERPPVTTGDQIEMHPAMWPDGRLFAGVPSQVIPKLRMGGPRGGGGGTPMARTLRALPLTARVAGSERAASFFPSHPDAGRSAAGVLATPRLGQMSLPSAMPSPRDLVAGSVVLKFYFC